MSSELINELSQNFIEYAAAVNSDRSIPDAKCGLKPVARRILYDAFANGHLSSKNYVKNATIVGEVIGKYHPHGDTSIYGALVRLAQDWVMRYPLIDFHGNVGNIAGDGAAAYRYTEGRLAKISEEGLLSGIKKRNVPFGPNFDESTEEPQTLPAIFPNLLCNPNTGIGVAMACNWAPHNLNEVAQAIYDYMDGKEPMLPGPDFPTGGIIINKDDIPTIMRTGHGSVKIRGKYIVEKNQIVFTEIPYGVNTESLLNEIDEVCEKKEIEGISKIQDQSNNKNGLRIVIICEKNANILGIVNKLFEKTSLQSSFSYNQVALIDKVPTEMNLAKCCEVYVNHNIECIKRETEYDLNEAKNRLHIVEGLLIALEDIDNVIKLIKESSSSSDAKINLMNKYNLDEIQAKAILAMRLSSLARLEKINLENEKTGLIKEISDLEMLLLSRDCQEEVVKERLALIVKKYGDARRTELIQITPPSKEEKEIINVEPEKCVVVVTEGGTIKRIPTSSFRNQRRNGKGVKTQEDITSMIIRTNTIDNLMIFSNQGRMYRLLVDNIPVGTNSSKGQYIRALVEMEPDEEFSTMYSIYRDTDAKYVIFVTKNGLVKKTRLDEYIKTKKKKGIGAISLKDGDSLAAVSLIKDENIILITKKGYIIKFKTALITETSRMTSGVKGINLADGDEVVAALPVRNENDSLAIFSTKGLGKKILPKEIVLQNRAGRGVIGYKVSDTSGDIAAAALVSDEDSILVVGNHNSICVSAKEIPALGRSCIGNVILKNNNIISVSKV